MPLVAAGALCERRSPSSRKGFFASKQGTPRNPAKECLDGGQPRLVALFGYAFEMSFEHITGVEGDRSSESAEKKVVEKGRNDDDRQVEWHVHPRN